MKKIMHLFMIVLCAIGLVACQPKEDAPVVDDAKPLVPNTEIHKVSDTRQVAYAAHNSEGVQTQTFNSLYTAIEYVVNNEDFGSYVTKMNGNDKDVKLFTYKERFASDSDDMFYYYSKANQLDTYTSWSSTYWQDLANIGDAIGITVSPSTGVASYFNSYALAGVSSTDASAKGTAYWNVTTSIEASVAVNMVAYSGITKQEYSVKLSESKFYPSMNQNQKVVPNLGFITADANNVSHSGLTMNPETGNWTYYSGEAQWNTNEIVADTEVLMTSTWNQAGYFVPNEDVNLTAETLALTDTAGGQYFVNRLTMHFVQSNRTVVKDYEYSALTQAGTIRFTANLDILNGDNLPDYMNGAKFENLVITKATATGYAEMQETTAYGTLAVLDAGVYDNLNSNPETAARYQTIIYNPAVVSTNFTTQGKDVYNFSYQFNTDVNAYSKTITNTQSLIDQLPEVESLTVADEAKVKLARTNYDLLGNFRNGYITNVEKLIAAEQKMNSLLYGEAITLAIEASAKVKTVSDYNSYAELMAASADIKAAFARISEFTPEVLAQVSELIGAEKVMQMHDLLLAVEAIKDEDLVQVIEYVLATKDYTFDGNVPTLAAFAELYEELTETQINSLPVLIKNVLLDETKINAFAKQFGYYMTTYNFIIKTMETYGLDIDVKEAVHGLVDVSKVNYEEIKAELASIVGLWQPGVMGESWNFRNNYAGRFDFVVEGGFAKYYPVFYSIIYHSNIYSYNWDTGFMNIL